MRLDVGARISEIFSLLQLSHDLITLQRNKVTKFTDFTDDVSTEPLYICVTRHPNRIRERFLRLSLTVLSHPSLSPALVYADGRRV